MFNSLIKRTKNSINGGGLKERIFFMHIPKCGGSSVDKALRNCYISLDKRKDRDLVRYDSLASEKTAGILFGYDFSRGSHKDLEILDFSEKFLAYNMCRVGARYISGHISFNEHIHDEFAANYKYVTLLRDPVKRFISAYFYAKYRTSNSDHWRIEEELPEFITTERGKSLGYTYVKYLCGLKKDADFTAQELIERAKVNLNKFDLVGLLEDMSGFAIAFEGRFGVRPKILKINESPVSQSNRQEQLDERVYNMVQEVCEPDLEIYNHACSMLSGHS